MPLFALTLACSDTTPANLSLAKAPDFLFSGDSYKANGRVVNKSGESLSEHPVDYSLTPTGIAEVSGAGVVTCSATGDATLLATGGGQVKQAGVRCRLIDRVELDSTFGTFTVEVGTPVAMGIKVMSTTDTEITDVPIKTKLADSSLAKVQGGDLVGLSAGATKMEISAGNIGGEVEVIVKEWVTVRVRMDSSKSSGASWDMPMFGVAAPEPFVIVDGRSFRSEGGGNYCRDDYTCSVKFLTQNPTGPYEVEVWDEDDSDHDYAGVTMCSRGETCRTNNAEVTIE